MHVVFYVSGKAIPCDWIFVSPYLVASSETAPHAGHGLGHATRAIVVAECLAARGHNVMIVAANIKLFVPLAHSMPSFVRIHQISYGWPALDPTVSQKDAVSVDVSKSIREMALFLKDWKEKSRQESEWLKTLGKIDCVLVDAPFIPITAAKHLHIPTILVSNFAFDSIFQGLDKLESSTQSEYVSSTLIDIYSNLDFVLRLPGAIPNPTFDFHGRTLQNICFRGSFERGVFDAISQPDPSSIIVKENVKACLKAIFPWDSTDFPTDEEIEIQLKAHKPVLGRKVENVPLVVRMATQTREEARMSLGIPLDAKVVLMTFGGHSVTTSTPSRPSTPLVSVSVNSQDKTAAASNHTSLHDYLDVSMANESVPTVVVSASPPMPHQTVEHLLPDGWHALIAVPGSKGDLLSDFIDVTPPSQMTIASPDAYVPNLLQASDVVVGKCGYGTCAEVVAHDIPLVYVPRPAFVEEVGLINNLMKPFGMIVEMPQEHFYSGRWAEHILEAYELRRTGPLLKAKVGGEEVVVDCIESIVKTSAFPS
ncbi:hypothetical protein HDU83_004808 [Entophlyctis luteolus]|nr:hypothetical protein HDU83_004808 [Entophlyctis luteolus]